MKKDTSAHLRKIFFETGASPNGRHRIYKMTEFLEHKGVQAKAQKFCHYYVVPQPHRHVEDLAPDKVIRSMQDAQRLKPRHVMIRREQDPAKGLGNSFCRRSGNFYYLSKGRIYAVVFIHTLRIDLIK